MYVILTQFSSKQEQKKVIINKHQFKHKRQLSRKTLVPRGILLTNIPHHFKMWQTSEYSNTLLQCFGLMVDSWKKRS